MSAIVTGNTFDWLQSDGTDIDGNPEDTSDYFFLDAGAPDTWMEGWTSVAEVDILHQNAALVGRVGTDGQVRFSPHEVPVIYEADVEYFTGQLVFNAGSTSGGFFRANQDIPANSGGFDTSEWTEVSLAAGGAVQYIYFRVTFNEDGSVAEVLEASTRLNQEIDPGETAFTDLPTAMPHTHFAPYPKHCLLYTSPSPRDS